jgi:type 2 lantibiotic biosynthesis protein LanM
MNLEVILKREGWSFHSRLEKALELSVVGDTAQAEQQLKAWSNALSENSTDILSKRLAWDGLDSAGAAWAIRPPYEVVPQDPKWYKLLEILRNYSRESLDRKSYPDLQDRCAEIPFVDAWIPIASWAVRELKDRLNKPCWKLSVEESVWLDLTAALVERLCETAGQAIWDLFNRKRSPGTLILAQISDHKKTRDSRDSFYKQFISDLLSDGYSLLLCEYPVLGRLISLVVDLWLSTCEELLRRTAINRSVLSEIFSVPTSAVLQGVRIGLSDPHRNGRGVAILQFRAGDEITRVVYKPKDMQIDLAYQEYLKVINTNSDLEPLRTLAIHACEGYGFMEWVEHSLCNTISELQNFYINAGRLMAILQLLGCTDCHHENLIASGEQLVLIDTETLFEAEIRDLVNDEGDDDSLSSHERLMNNSVLRTGLLPQWTIVGAGKKQAYDISALGIQLQPKVNKVAGWIDLNCDGMRPGLVTEESEIPTSLPIRYESQHPLAQYVDQVISGFDLQMKEVIQLRELFISQLELFSGKPRRLVARPTRLYYVIQRQMLQPSNLRSAVSHGLRIEQLCRAFLMGDSKPQNWEMLRSEIRYMEQLDIPYFEHLIDGEKLPLAHGLQEIDRLIVMTGACAAQQRIKDLSRYEIKIQKRLIRGAVEARMIREASSVEESIQMESDNRCRLDSKETVSNLYFHEAVDLAQEIWNEGLHDESCMPDWLGIDLANDGQSFNFGLVGPSLYSGKAGLALLFARMSLGRSAHDARVYREKAWSCLQTVINIKRQSSTGGVKSLIRYNPLGLTGIGGFLLSLKLLKLAGVSQVDFLGSTVIDNLQGSRISTEVNADIMSGLAGLIGPLLMYGSPSAVALAKACGERIVQLQQESGGWTADAYTTSQQHRPLTGFSHGAAGIGAALARLWHITGVPSFRLSALKAISYEDSVFVREDMNWPDLRKADDSRDYMDSWCTGAPGILLARLVFLESGIRDIQILSDIKKARALTIKALMNTQKSSNHDPVHLCCGLMGLTSLLRTDARVRGVELDNVIDLTDRLIVESKRKRGYYPYFNLKSDSLSLPGLFTGKAGTALALIEAYDAKGWIDTVLSAGLICNC